ncbi:transposase [Streptomyces prasinosporus]|uniref:transposase n=1 Tax=Streptomyces prasinosporus TaxID=68256 RepID=UPI003CD06095
MLGRQFLGVTGDVPGRQGGPDRVRRLPHRHRKKTRSTGPPERPNREVEHRTDVVRAFPDPPAALRPATAVLAELRDEGIVFPRPPPLPREHGRPPRRHPDRPARRIKRLIACTTRRGRTCSRSGWHGSARARTAQLADIAGDSTSAVEPQAVRGCGSPGRSPVCGS